MVADANTFTNIVLDIFGGGCGSVQSYNNNKFVSGYRGIVMVSNPGQYFEILANTFDGSAAPNMGVGIHMGGGTQVNKINDNVITNISESAAADMAAGVSGYGLIMGGHNILQAPSATSSTTTTTAC